MKFPRILFSVTALSALATLVACGGVSSNTGRNHQPPPPPTGTYYTTCNSTAGSSQLVPDWQSTQFISNYQPAIQALVQHVSQASYASQVGYIRVGLGKGGEINLPGGWSDSSSGPCYGGFTVKWGYSAGTPNSSWNQYLATMLNFEGSLSSPKPLLVSITPISASGTETDDYIAPIAVQNGISYGNQGLESSDITDFPNCGGDWCTLFQSSPPAIKELQTIGQSCPQGVSCSGQQASTGPLPPLLQFATGVGGSGIPIVPAPANDLEIYYQDWLIAYDPSYASSQGVDSTQAAAYASAIQAASAHATMQVLFPDPTNSDIQTFVLSQSDAAGVVIDVDWSDIQPNAPPAAFDWSITDGSINYWLNHGAKKVNLVFQNTTYGGNNCSGNSIGSNGQSSSGNCAMPAWMWTVLQ